jgi:hypothetical protein
MLLPFVPHDQMRVDQAYEAPNIHRLDRATCGNGQGTFHGVAGDLVVASTRWSLAVDAEVPAHSLDVSNVKIATRIAPHPLDQLVKLSAQLV